VAAGKANAVAAVIDDQAFNHGARR
jgi:hypothetical protein